MTKDFFQKLTLVLGSLVFLFLLGELIFKLMAFVQPNQTGASSVPGLPYENSRNASFWRLDREAGYHLYAHNAHGMRGPEITLKKPKNTFRIALLGDSVMHGGNVNQGQTTADFLKASLDGVKDLTLETLNFGVSSYSLREYAIQLEHKVFSFSPDVVVVGLCLNDYLIRNSQDLAIDDKNSKKNWWNERFSNLFRSHFLEFLSKTFQATWDRFSQDQVSEEKALQQLARMSFLSQSEKQILKNYAASQHIPLERYLNGVVSYIGVYRDSASWQANEPFIRAMVEACRKKNIPIYFFCYPSAEQLLEGYDNRMPQEFLGPWLRSMGAEYVEILDAFIEYDRINPSKPLYPRLDPLHFFAKGHEITARVVSRALEPLIEQRA